MPRQRTKGDSIAFRLPVHKDKLLEAAAAEVGMSPRDFAAKLVEDYLDGHRTPPPSTEAAAGVSRSGPGAALAAELLG